MSRWRTIVVLDAMKANEPESERREQAWAAGFVFWGDVSRSLRRDRSPRRFTFFGLAGRVRRSARVRSANKKIELIESTTVFARQSEDRK